MAKDTKPEESPVQEPEETPAEPVETPEETQTPDEVQEFLTKKGFASSEDAFQAYEELERHKSRLEQDNASLRRATQQTFADRTKPAQKPDETNEEFLKRLAEDPRGTLTQFYHDMARPSQIDQALDWVAGQEDYTPAADPRLAEIVNENNLYALPPLKAARAAMAIYREELRVDETPETTPTPRKAAPEQKTPAESVEGAKRSEKVRASQAPKKGAGGGEPDISKLSAKEFKEAFNLSEQEE